jgi:hypothetical protein
MRPTPTQREHKVHNLYQLIDKQWKHVGWRCITCDKLYRTLEKKNQHLELNVEINTSKENKEMPIQRIMKNGKQYYRYEDNGKLYDSIKEAEDAKSNSSGYKKKKGADDKACWEGYRYAGTENGSDKCVKIKKD